MAKKTYKYKSEWGDTYNLQIAKHVYSENGTLAIQLIDVDEHELFAIITVNLPFSDTLESNQQFINTNDLPNIGEWLTENGIAKKVKGATATSGFCTYPVYEFDLSKI